MMNVMCRFYNLSNERKSSGMCSTTIKDERRERKCPKLLKDCPCGKPAVRLNNEDDFLLTSWHITTASCWYSSHV